MAHSKIYRGWINQPSKLQDCHKFHGEKVLVENEGEGMATIYFCKGPIISARLPLLIISKGWPEQELN